MGRVVQQEEKEGKQAMRIVKKVEWVVKASGKERPAAVIKAISEKGGIDTKKIMLGE